MRHGPVDVVLLAFGKPEFDGSVAAELQRLAREGTIRVLDAMFVIKGEDGAPLTLDMEDMPEEERQSFGFVESGTRGLFDSEDAETLTEGMAPGSGLVALAIEHAWALRLREALENSGATLAMDIRIPAAVVDEAYATAAAR